MNPPRNVAVDAYRGFVMLAMVSHGFGLAAVVRELANRKDPNTEIWRTIAYQFDHVPWVGCVFWDLIQPSFMFLVGPAGVPEPILQKLSADVRVIVDSAEFAAKAKQLGTDPKSTTPEELRLIIRTEIEKWAAVAKAAHITAE